MTFKSDYYKVWEEELKEDSVVDEQTAMPLQVACRI